MSLSGIKLTCNCWRKNYLTDLTFNRAVVCFGRAVRNVKQTTLLLNITLFDIAFIFNLVNLVSHEEIIQKGIQLLSL